MVKILFWYYTRKFIIGQGSRIMSPYIFVGRHKNSFFPIYEQCYVSQLWVILALACSWKTEALVYTSLCNHWLMSIYLIFYHYMSLLYFKWESNILWTIWYATTSSVVSMATLVSKWSMIYLSCVPSWHTHIVALNFTLMPNTLIHVIRLRPLVVANP